MVAFLRFKILGSIFRLQQEILKPVLQIRFFCGCLRLGALAPDPAPSVEVAFRIFLILIPGTGTGNFFQPRPNIAKEKK